MKEALNKLANLADDLDSKGLSKEANIIDVLIKKAILVNRFSALINKYGADAIAQPTVDYITRQLEKLQLPSEEIVLWKNKTSPSSVTLNDVLKMIENDELPGDLAEAAVGILEITGLRAKI